MEQEIKVSKKPGVKPKYTDEERKEAQRASVRKYYQNNREYLIKKQTDKHKFQRELARKYKEGKLTEND